MFDIGWVEIGLIAVVALIVIGPKDLPQAMRTLTGMIRKLRGMMREFQSGVDDLVREAELKELRDEVEKSARDSLGDLDPSIDPTGGLGDPFEDDGKLSGGSDEPKKIESNSKDSAGGTDEAADKPAAKSASKPKTNKAAAKPKAAKKTGGKTAKKAPRKASSTKAGLTKKGPAAGASKAKAT